MASTPVLLSSSPVDVPISMTELLAALASIKKSTCPGPNEVTYTTLSHLGENGKRCLLNVFNHSRQTGYL